MKKPPMFLRLPCPTCGQSTLTINGAMLKEWRQRANLTQRAFGEMVGLSSPYLSDIERNRRACPPDVLEAYQVLAKEKP